MRLYSQFTKKYMNKNYKIYILTKQNGKMNITI